MPFHPDTLDRMFRAPLLVRERLHKSTAALDAAEIPNCVIGANAVAYWVDTLDSGASRNTPNVDILIRRSDVVRVREALAAGAFVFTPSSDRPLLFLDATANHLRQAVQVWCVGDQIKAGLEPLPDVHDGVRGPHFRVVPLGALVRMKLAAFRLIDKVHIRDMMGVGLIDASWPDRFPPVLADRLREILADPDG